MATKKSGFVANPSSYYLGDVGAIRTDLSQTRLNPVNNANSPKATTDTGASGFASDRTTDKIGGTGSGGGGDGNDVSSLYLDEIQKAEHDKNYKTLLQSDIAAYNLKLNTQKYLDNYLANQGLSTQGYGTSAHVGAENQLSNLYAQNLENYNTAETQSYENALSRKSANDQESDNQLAQFLTYTDGSDEQIASYMNKYGYKETTDGKWVKEDGTEASPYILGMIEQAKNNGTNNSNNLTDNIAIGKAADNFIKAHASTYSGVDSNGYEMNSKSDKASNAYMNYDSLSKVLVGRVDNTNYGTLGSVVGDELKDLANRIADNQVKDGTLIKLQRASGSKEAYLLMYRNGKIYFVSSDDNEQEGGEVSTNYNAYKGPKISLSREG